MHTGRSEWRQFKLQYYSTFTLYDIYIVDISVRVFFVIISQGRLMNMIFQALILVNKIHSYVAVVVIVTKVYADSL